MMDIECPKPAYDRLIKAGLDKKVLIKIKVLHDIFLYNNPFELEGSKILKIAKDTFSKMPERKISEKTEVSKQILTLKQILDEDKYGIVSSFKFGDLLVQYPAFLGYLILRNDLFDFEKYGFPSRASLEESITSFCISNYEIIMDWGRDYLWRSRNFKNLISQNMHGDLYASQTDFSGRECEEQTLFGIEEKFDTIKKDSEKKTIYAYQDWSDFLMATLRYSEVIGKAKIPEIVDWKDVLGKVGAVGTATAEAMFGETGIDLKLHFLEESPILVKGNKIEGYLLSVKGQNSNFFPYVEDKKLIYLENNENGKTLPEFEGTRLENIKFSRTIEYCEQDLPHVLAAIYRLFARDRSLLPKIMNIFLSQSHQYLQNK